MSELGPARVLVVDDDEPMREGLRVLLQKEGLLCDAVGSAEEAISRLNEVAYGLVLSDVRMPGASGLDLLDEAHKLDPELPVVLLTGYATVSNAVEAIRRGAFDYIAKPFTLDEVRLVVRRALERRALVTEVAHLRREVVSRHGFGDVVAGPQLRPILELAHRVAPANSSVLITGETGTGKELIAKAIHNASARAARPFLVVNCGALAPNLVESELFGHVRGAFTGAVEARAGYFEVASGGTLFLDEIGELPAALQVKLLRVLQDGSFQRVGETRTRTADVRILAATHRGLEDEMRAGRFREDLFYRLAVVQIRLPALRERPDDIAPLATFFMERYAREFAKPVPRISNTLLARLCAYQWPGNVRELQNAIERGVLLSDGITLADEALPPAATSAAAPAKGSGIVSLAEHEKSYIQHVLGAAKGSKNLAAKLLGITRRTLYRKLEKHGIQTGSTDAGDTDHGAD